jgi:hypothetical protein
MMHGIQKIGILSINFILMMLMYIGPVNLNPLEEYIYIKKKPKYFLIHFPIIALETNPYIVLFGQNDWTCSIANFTGTHTNPMVGENGKTIPPTNKKFHIEFCTVAHWKNGQIMEERLFYDLVGLMRQLGWIQ